jgi:hypothetical protein
MKDARKKVYNETDVNDIMTRKVKMLLEEVFEEEFVRTLMWGRVATVESPLEQVKLNRFSNIIKHLNQSYLHSTDGIGPEHALMSKEDNFHQILKKVLRNYRRSLKRIK